MEYDEFDASEYMTSFGNVLHCDHAVLVIFQVIQPQSLPLFLVYISFWRARGLLRYFSVLSHATLPSSDPSSGTHVHWFTTLQHPTIDIPLGYRDLYFP